MRTSIILILSILSVVIVKGQIDTYPLDQYKRPNLNRTTFVLDGFLDSNNEFISNNENSDESLLRLNINSYYEKFKNNSSSQTFLYHLTRINTVIDNESEEKYSTTLQHTTRYNTRRFNENNLFLRVTPQVQVLYEFGNAIDDHDKTIGTSILLGGGKGRVELVNDAWLATSILQALKDGGKLEREPTHQEITYFAEEIARIKNARVLDFRNKIIFELDEIFKYIMNLGLVKENTLAFAIVYDAWQYEIYAGRSTGSILESYVSPSYFFRNGENS